jgi:hypothetical protein
MLDNARIMNRDITAAVEGRFAALALSSFFKRFKDGAPNSPILDELSRLVREFGTAISSSVMKFEKLIPRIKEASLRFNR